MTSSSSEMQESDTVYAQPATHTPTTVEPLSDIMGRVLELIVFASPLVPPGTRDPAITSEGVLVFSSIEDEAAYKSVLRVKCPRGAQTVLGKKRCHELGSSCDRIGAPRTVATGDFVFDSGVSQRRTRSRAQNPEAHR